MAARRMVLWGILAMLVATPAVAGPPPEPPSPPPHGAAQLLDLNERTSKLADDVRASHARLSLMLEQLTGDTEGASELVVRLDDELGGWFRMTGAKVVLDGQVELALENGERVSGAKRPVFRGFLAPGAHTVQVLVKARGNGHGVFSYLNAYRFELKGAHSLTTTAGTSTRLRIVVYDQGGVERPFDERPAVRWAERVSPLEP
jgi:hypothetical protein